MAANSQARGGQRQVPPRRRRLSADERQAQILDVARETFAEVGFQAATTLMMAERVGVSETLVIKYFGSKENLFRAAVAQPLLDIVDRQIAVNRVASSTRRREMSPKRTPRRRTSYGRWRMRCGATEACFSPFWTPHTASRTCCRRWSPASTTMSWIWPTASTQ